MPTLSGSASGLVQCLVSSRSTRPVQVRDSCRRYCFRAGLRASLANCVRSDARRRQSRSSSLSNYSDFDIAHRLESSMRSVARYRVSCRWPTPHTKTKRHPVRSSTTYGVVGYVCKEKAPRSGGTLPKLSISVSPSRQRRDTTWQHSRDVRSLAQRNARRSGFFLPTRQVNTQRFAPIFGRPHARFPTSTTVNST
jgi:hypothetical protein